MAEQPIVLDSATGGVKGKTAADFKALLAIASGDVSGLGSSTSYSMTGTLVVKNGDFRWYNDTGRTLTFGTIRASVGTAPTGAAVIVDVLVDGTTIYSGGTGRPTIAISANTATGGTPSTTTIANGSYITVNVAQVGSTLPGTDLTLTVNLIG